MSNVAIRCDGVSKQYRIGERESYRAIRDVITDTMYAPFRRLRSTIKGLPKVPRESQSSFWALDDVSFEVKQGEVIGIIGHNGAGKSTLLKVLSRITSPTKGEVDIRGRVGSLLEVGTGFHPELTGRENVFLNGSILGMRRAEVERKFDEIVAFAEIEKFIDTPVKRYSTGMYVRLAFAVAVHLEPEVLIVDEVLAVGDAEFQKKCFRKMQEVGKDNRTILLVSHNMAAIRNICSRGLVLERGRVVASGDIDNVVDSYLARINNSQADGETVETESYVVDNVRVGSTGEQVVKTFNPVEINIRITAKTDIAEPDVYMGILTLDGQILTALVCRDFCSIPALLKGSSAEVTFKINSLPLLPGEYQIEIHLVDLVNYKFEFVPRTYPFEVVETPIYGGRKLDRWFGHIGLDGGAGVQILNS
ncbi:MAG TPA: ABC transporter ATP-binding protein [Pyrinomonadaceae bacterium]|jgi:lipopolysaccharide transport system ATP-binding protein